MPKIMAQYPKIGIVGSIGSGVLGILEVQEHSCSWSILDAKGREGGHPLLRESHAVVEVGIQILGKLSSGLFERVVKLQMHALTT